MRNVLIHRRSLLPALVAALLLAGPAQAETLNCVQFVQQISSINLHGDAWQWWEAALGYYDRGERPAVGAVMVFSRTLLLPHGHVAVVRSVQDPRTVLVDHANWSHVHGRRNGIEQAAAVIDVSPANDWSQVRVWYDPVGDIGQTVYALRGFVYPARSRLFARG